MDGEDITEMTEEELSEVQKKFSYVFQGGALFDSLTVGENVAFGLQQLGSIRRRRSEEIVEGKAGAGGPAGDRGA